MINRVVYVQIYILFIVTGVLCLLWGVHTGMSFLLAGASLALPNVFLVINAAVSRFSTVILWFGFMFNKFISTILLLVSVKILEYPQWPAFIAGIIIIGHVPFGYGIYKSVYNQN